MVQNTISQSLVPRGTQNISWSLAIFELLCSEKSTGPSMSITSSQNITARTDDHFFLPSAVLFTLLLEVWNSSFLQFFLLINFHVQLAHSVFLGKTETQIGTCFKTHLITAKMGLDIRELSRWRCELQGNLAHRLHTQLHLLKMSQVTSEDKDPGLRP